MQANLHWHLLKAWKFLFQFIAVSGFPWAQLWFILGQTDWLYNRYLHVTPEQASRTTNPKHSAGPGLPPLFQFGVWDLLDLSHQCYPSVPPCPVHGRSFLGAAGASFTGALSCACPAPARRDAVLHTKDDGQGEVSRGLAWCSIQSSLGSWSHRLDYLAKVSFFPSSVVSPRL